MRNQTDFFIVNGVFSIFNFVKGIKVMELQYRCILKLNVKDTKNIKKLKKAYRKGCLEWHPDKHKNKDTTEQFIKIQEAYHYFLNKLDTPIETPIKQQKRYEEFYIPDEERIDAAEIEPLINYKTGKTFNIKIYIELNIYEVFNGCTKTIEYEKTTICKNCNETTFQSCNICRRTRYRKEIHSRRLCIEKSTFEGSKYVFKGEGHENLYCPCGDIIVYIGESFDKTFQFLRVNYDLIATKHITIEESISKFSFYLELPNKTVLKVKKRSNKVLIPYSNLYIPDYGFWDKEKQEYGALCIRFVIVDANTLSIKKRKRWAALMICDYDVCDLESNDIYYKKTRKQEKGQLFTIKVM